MAQTGNESTGSAQGTRTAATLGLLRLTDRDFRFLQDFVYKHVGIHLTDQKRSLVEGRLQQIMRARGFSKYSQYCDYLQKDASGQAMDELVNRISTNHTYFYREKNHFDFFSKTVLPELKQSIRAKGGNDLRLWCAGCSSGEEPYTLVMLMLDFFGPEYVSWQAGILATDISAKVLSIAQQGVYPEDRIKPLPMHLKSKYVRNLGHGNYQITEQVRREVIYRRFNLMNKAFPFKKPFHSIFCRNVMIYFDNPTKKALVRRFYDFTEPGGYLFIGHSESLGREDCPYEYVMPAVYRKV